MLYKSLTVANETELSRDLQRLVIVFLFWICMKNNTYTLPLLLLVSVTPI